MDNSSRLAALKNRVRQGQGTSLVEAIANATKNNSQTPPTSSPQINDSLVGSSPQSGENNFDSSPKSPIIYSQLPSPQGASGPPIISSGSVSGTPPPVIESSNFKKSTQEILDAIRKNRASKITTAVTETASLAATNVPAPEAQPNTVAPLSVPLITFQPVNASTTDTSTDTSFMSDIDMIDLSTQVPNTKQNNPPVQSNTIGVKRPLSAVAPNAGLRQASDAITITSSSSNSTSHEEPPYKRQKLSNTNNVPSMTVTPKSPARPLPQTTTESNNNNFVNEFSARRKEAVTDPSVSNAIKNSYLRSEPVQESRPEPRSDNSAMSEEEAPQENNNQEEQPKKQKKPRVIPGPAGALPQLLTEDGKPAIPDLSSQKPNNAEKLLNSPVLIRSPKKDPNTLSVDMKKRLEDEVDFRKGPWLSMLCGRKLPPYGSYNPNELLQCNLRYVLTRGFASKVPELVLFVKSVKSIDEDALVEVKDPTATAEATIHRQLLERLNQQPLQGSVLHVKSISVWSPPPARKVHHLVITAANLIAHYPVDSPIPDMPGEVNVATYSLLSPYNLRVTDAELEAKSPSKIARAAMPKMANSTAGTPKRPSLPEAASKSNGTSIFGDVATAAQPKVPTARGQPMSPAPKAPPKYSGHNTPGGPPKYGAPKTPYRPPPQNSPAPGPSKTPYRPTAGPNQIVTEQSQTPVSPTRPSPPYNVNSPTQGTPKQPPRPAQAPFDINNPANQMVGNDQPNYTQPPQPNFNRPQPQQPLRRSPQDFPHPSNNPNVHSAPPTYQPNVNSPQPNRPPIPRPVNNNPPPHQPYGQAQQPYNASANQTVHNSPAQPRPYNAPNNIPAQPYSATPINTNLPSQTPTSSMPSSGLSHATSNLSGSISNFSRSGNNRFLAGMAANNVWGNPTLNANNTAPQSTSGQILPDPNNRR